jgi:hypothetical protein
MNIAGLMAYAYSRYEAHNWDSILQAQSELGLVGREIPRRPFFDFSESLPPLRAVKFEELREAGRVGVFTLDDGAYRRATQDLRRVNEPEGAVWIEAFQTSDGDWILAPQLESEGIGIYLFAPIVSQGTVRLSTFDTGLRADGDHQPPAIVGGKCERGVDDQLNWICLRGTCTGQCEPNGWVSGNGPAELSGCRCS